MPLILVPPFPEEYLILDNDQQEEQSYMADEDMFTMPSEEDLDFDF